MVLNIIVCVCVYIYMYNTKHKTVKYIGQLNKKYFLFIIFVLFVTFMCIFFNVYTF